MNSKAVWPVRPRHAPVSVLLVLELQTHTTIPIFFSLTRFQVIELMFASKHFPY